MVSKVALVKLPKVAVQPLAEEESSMPAIIRSLGTGDETVPVPLGAGMRCTSRATAASHPARDHVGLQSSSPSSCLINTRMMESLARMMATSIEYLMPKLTCPVVTPDGDRCLEPGLLVSTGLLN